MKRLLLIFVLLISVTCGARQLRHLVWVLDAGHGGKDQGTSIRNVLEKDLTLNLTNRVAALIRKNKPGIKLILTRDDDTFVSLEERCLIANKAKADLFLSIHINFTENNLLLSGTETFYANKRVAQDMVQASNLERNADNSELLAWLLQNSYYNSGRPTDRGARANNLYVLMHTEMPAALTEVGFLSNVSDATYMCSERGQKQIALDIYNALDAYYNVTKAKKQKKTLRDLRQSRGTISGIKTKRAREASSAEDLMPMQDPFARGDNEAATSILSNVQPSVSNKNEEDAVEENPLPVFEEEITKPENTPADNSSFSDESQQEKEAEKEVENPKEEANTAPLFSVQLFAVSKKIKDDDPRLKGLSPVKTVQSGSVYKVLYGTTTDYKEARATLAQIKEKFPDAFVVAYVGERLVSTAEALQMKR